MAKSKPAKPAPQWVYLSPEAVDIILSVYSFFQDEIKTAAWMKMENLNFGGVSPNFLINNGRGEWLRKWVDEQLDSNKGIENERG